MTEELKKHEGTIKKKHSFSWTPKFEEVTRTNLNKKVFVPIVVKTFEKLGWDLVFQDDLSAEAKRKGKWNRWTEKITVTYEYGKVRVKSISLGNEMWDNGNNSKRVRLFIYVFEKTEKEYDQESLTDLEKEIERKNNWDDYIIPEILPKPKPRKKPKFWIIGTGGILTSFLLGFLIAFLSIKGIYVIVLFEVGVAVAMGFILKYLIRISNYTNYYNLHYLLIGMIIVTYLSNQYFQYQLILHINNLEPIGFLKFIEIRLEAGLMIKSVNTGWVGLIISWIVQLGLTYIVGKLKLASNLTSYQLERIPMEVVDFTYYHFVKEKTEDQVRYELTKLGWSEKQDQDEVFESIGAIHGASELNRI